MKTFERILIKIIIVQFFFLIGTQIFIHSFNILPEIKQLAEYEGVSESNFTKLIETFNGE
ncbi:hypothetical protein CVD25_05250 [Bacillus canaveralius]|uniref:YpfB family protein n=1 Tax=Bacillus canaveralius TaxID=1403243 RepID=A0A2N5GRQ4_9BACI|nr:MULTISPECIES: YpfB family protein [Bacillus]PLR83065.1 hypothetical protein CVD23_15600 [Bacillus sp. V33-4]PLR86121.1 hypothetical protein CU635_03540 [Bacillus canaveralius]PLS00241.1 hypothetical protein CVD25_05250 [Bacillus canaveralius]RSK51995.1 hypothetical protein EJA13_12515 [Bacillus canaveralius]